MGLKYYIGLLSTEVNCILCEQWDFQFSLRLFVSAAGRIRMGSLNLLKTFDAHPSEARASQLSDLTTAQSGKRQLFDVDGHRTHLVWIFKVFQSHIVNYRGSSASSNMHWLTAETSEHSQIFIFGKLKSGSSCVLERWRNWGIRWAGDFPGLGRAVSRRLWHKAGKLFDSRNIGNISNKEILTTLFASPQKRSYWNNLLRWCSPLCHLMSWCVYLWAWIWLWLLEKMELCPWRSLSSPDLAGLQGLWGQGAFSSVATLQFKYFTKTPPTSPTSSVVS